jgi:hydroxymethylpyrimidine pyrophosphatase-like HAD family hydrolase
VEILALATDYDGTLAEEGVTAPSTIAALARFKASGRKLILVTGRPLGELKIVFSRLDLFDVVVAENGGLLYFPETSTVRLLAAPPSEFFVTRLRELGVDELAVGETIIATHIGHHETMRRTITALAIDLEIILNTDALMVLPVGTNKASGLVAALAELSLSPASVAAIGDAENDIVFLKHCGYAVAVANALPEVKAVAHVVTTESHGAGVEELIAMVLEQPDRLLARPIVA